MLGDIFEGAVKFGASYIGGKKRLRQQEEAQAGYEQAMQSYLGQDVSTPYLGMENVYEDLTVNTQAADFAASQQAQGLSDIMGQTRQAAGGSGIAALAQALAGQQAQAAQQASASIGQQEAGLQRLAAGEAGRIQGMERQGEAYSRGLQMEMAEAELGMSQQELAQRNLAIQQARGARAEGIGQLVGGVGQLGSAALAGYTGNNDFMTQLSQGYNKLNS